MRENPKPQELYRHFKGNLYQIQGIAKDSENGKEMVVYQALYGDFCWYVRSLQMFMSEVDMEKYPNCTQKYRFEKVEKTSEVPLEAKPVQETTEKVLTPEEVETEGIEENQEETAEDFKENQEETTEIGVIGKPIPSKQSEEGESVLDPLVLDFLDADSYVEKLNILAALHHRITHEMITLMAISCDVEVGEMDLEDRYQELRYCLTTKDRFEIRRH